MYNQRELAAPFLSFTLTIPWILSAWASPQSISQKNTIVQVTSDFTWERQQDLKVWIDTTTKIRSKSPLWDSLSQPKRPSSKTGITSTGSFEVFYKCVLSVLECSKVLYINTELFVGVFLHGHSRPLFTWEQRYLLLSLSTTNGSALEVAEVQAEPTINTACKEKPLIRTNRLKRSPEIENCLIRLFGKVLDSGRNKNTNQLATRKKMPLNLLVINTLTRIPYQVSEISCL